MNSEWLSNVVGQVRYGRTRKLLLILGAVIVVGSWLPGDTVSPVPLRGTNTLAKGQFRIPGFTGVFDYKRSIPDQPNFPSMPPSPPGLLDSVLGQYGAPQFKRILPNTYLLIKGSNDTIVVTNEPTVRRRKGYWEID